VVAVAGLLLLVETLLVLMAALAVRDHQVQSRAFQ
jgi:hypothetical protein